ncbi:putative RNA pseudouridine synthase [Campylobacterota bacterium]|nr:putative RNA pseudouridine synthase [Campylobacterota bacterium]
MNDKAYKLLSRQEHISNGEAKRLIDDGLVFVAGKKLTIARKELESETVFKVSRQQNARVIFENDDLFALDKPIAAESYDLEKRFGHKLIHRLDKQTSGVLLLAKNGEFLTKAIAEFKAKTVVKKYLAVVEGIVAEELRIDLPIYTEKGSKARSVVDKKRGKEALTIATPLQVENRRTLLEVQIVSGRTHQIRVHLSHIGHPILGDESYGGKEYKRLMLHASFVSLLGYEIRSPTPTEFAVAFR